MTLKAKEGFEETSKTVRKNKKKYTSIFFLATIVPFGSILGPIAIVRELKRDKKEAERKKGGDSKEESEKPDPPFSFF